MRADERVLAALGGPVSAETLRLLWTASLGDDTLALELVRGGLEYGALERQNQTWRWGGRPGAAARRLAELIESRAAVLTGAQLTALETLITPLAEPLAAINRVRLARAAGVRLTPRERDVLSLLSAGLSATAIARRLRLSPRTVTKHQERLYRKLGVCDRVNAVLLAQRLGLVSAPS
ncbi:hypothetical protein Skr01_54120 [Sphaerisporangium krabiense]|uniref:DNA-binding CsgD family transcriptional regulator n=1 Tax=Sphaerisporangium krabiense TaxID=763782 RepID=A0A7W9DQ59_9ACTN|nr:LuxR C-terminal-related transcriptional regulator [Sphaerisporangium krabiense]MBB5627171.1 DNA-binding CsgD family transcriptional regulator [Sphaerisporangium krabiense]GII65327.1 hypothetical protein Skr01_54120 [Sphaerisporangium krabiense]